MQNPVISSDISFIFLLCLI